MTRTLTRPIEIPEPHAEGDWDLHPSEAGDDDA